MIKGKYGAVIGRETPSFCICPISISRLWIFSANHSAVFPHDHRSNHGISPNDSV